VERGGGIAVRLAGVCQEGQDPRMLRPLLQKRLSEARGIAKAPLLQQFDSFRKRLIRRRPGGHSARRWGLGGKGVHGPRSVGAASGLLQREKRRNRVVGEQRQNKLRRRPFGAKFVLRSEPRRGREHRPFSTSA